MTQQIENRGCTTMMVYVICVVLLLLTSCKTVSEKESYIEDHRIYSMIERMDSVISKSYTIQNDSSWHEKIVKELESIKERNDTTHLVVVDSAGNVIKEKLEIWHEKEYLNETDRQEILGMIHKMEKMDSMLYVYNQLIIRMDSLYQAKEYEETITEDDISWYKKLWLELKYILIGVIIGAILILTNAFWKKIIKLLI